METIESIDISELKSVISDMLIDLNYEQSIEEEPERRLELERIIDLLSKM